MTNFGERSALISRAQQDDEATVNDKASRDPIPAAEPDTV